MAHTLTFDYSVYCKVNGVMKDSPYTLSNGDVITLIPNYTDFAVNETVYSSSVANTIAISNSDINITTNSETPTTQGPESTINYTEASTPRLSVDVSTLAGWANLAAGSHDITIVAKAAGFKDSAPSTAVSVTKAASTKTLKAGTYKWKDSVTLIDIDQDIEFTSNNTQYAIIKSNEGRAVITYTASYNDAVYNNGAWTSTALQTITLATDQQVSADFYEWAITGGNLVAQPAGETWVLNNEINEYSGATTGEFARGLNYLTTEFETNGYNVKSLIFDSRGSYTSSGGWGMGIQSIAIPSSASATAWMYEDGGGWTSTAFKTWVFSTAPTGDLLTWLQANGKQRT